MPRNVLYVSPCAERAGAEQLTRLFILNHDPKLWAPEIFFFKDGPFREELEHDGVICHVAPDSSAMRLRNPLSVFKMARALSQVIRERKIDLVHSMMGYGHIVGGLGAKMAGRPEVWFQHGPTGRLDYLTGLVPSRTLFVNSEHTKSRQQRYHARTKHLSLIYPAVDPGIRVEDFAASAVKLRREWSGDRQEFIFGLVGRMAPMKGQQLLVEAAKILVKSHPDVRIVLVGSTFDGHAGSYATDLQSQIRTSGIQERVTLTGYLPAPQGAILACDCIVNATVNAEPFGLTLIEAMQLGKPVIAPDQGGPLEIVEEGKEGFFFRAGDVDSLVVAMERMIELKKNELRWKSMEANALQKANHRFGLKRMMTELETEYKRACSRD